MRRTRNYDQEEGQEVHSQSASPFPFAAAASANSDSQKSSSSVTDESAPCRTCTDFRTWMKMQKSGGGKKAEDEQKRYSNNLTFMMTAVDGVD